MSTSATSTANPADKASTPLSRQSYVYKSLPTRLSRKANSSSKPLGSADKEASLHNLTISGSIRQGSPQILCAVSPTNSQVSENARASTPLDPDVLGLRIDDCLQELDDYLEQLDTSTETSKRDADYSFGEGASSPADNHHNAEPYSLNSNETEAGLDSLNESRMQHEFHNNAEENLPRFNAADFESTNFNDSWPSKLPVKLEPFEADDIEANQDRSASRPNTSEAASNQTLTTEQIFNNFLIECSQEPTTGPRQLGRRATGQPTVLSARSNTPNDPSCTVARSYLNNRPYSAPANNSRYSNRPEANQRSEHPAQYHITSSSPISEASSLRTSHNPSPVSSVYTSTDSSSLSAASNPHVEASITLNLQSGQEAQSNQQQQTPEADASAAAATTSPATAKSHTEWPYVLSQSFALTTCTLGLFNMCRFSTLVLNYGGNFVLQFLLLSFFFGIPLLWLQMCLGARIKSGPVSMWRISPICKGIGISLIIVQFVISIYSAVCLAWLLVYLRDSLPSSNQFVTNDFRSRNSNVQMSPNSSVDFSNDVGQYFSVHVLQRLVGDRLSFRISERLAFYLAFLWTAVFLILCRGLRSLGNFVYLLAPVPLTMLAVIVTKLLFVVDCSKLRNIFSAAYLEDFLISPHAWTAAVQETFLTWGLLGPSVIAMTSRKHTKASKTALRSNAIFVVFVTFFGLFLAALLGLCAMEVLERSSFIYIPGSYETPETSKSIYYKPRLEPDMISFPPQLVPHYSGFVGETYRRTMAVAHQKSGYQALRFISEIFPAFAVLSKLDFEWGWVFATLLTFLLFGLAQLCAMWKPISSALGNSTNAVLLSCVTGLLLSIPFTTEIGIHILHYVDIVFGASWIVPIMWMALIFGIFLVRGRPYNGDELVNDLEMSTSISAFLALSWNVLLPIGLPTLAIISYKMSNSSQFFNWRSRVYFTFWERKVAGIIQVMLLLLLPITAIVQIVRYLNRGPTDILERIQLLYRPPEGDEARPRIQSPASNAPRPRNHVPLEEESSISMPPPKYTPPPSYTTATGARMAKMLRQSIRRSVRRIRAVATHSRPWSTEPENELIVSNVSNTQTFNDIGNVESAEDSFTQAQQQTCHIEAPLPAPTPTRSFTSTLRAHRPDRRSQSLPRSLQRSTISNFSTATTTVDGIDRLLNIATTTTTNPTTMSRAPTEEMTASRSVDNLASNAEPLDQSQPPLHIVIRTRNKQFN